MSNTRSFVEFVAVGGLGVTEETGMMDVYCFPITLPSADWLSFALSPLVLQPLDRQATLPEGAALLGSD